MTKISGSDAMFQVLYDWGIDHIYGFQVAHLIQQ